jgi:hypothetical protein
LDAARTAFEWLVTGPHPTSVEGWRFPGLPRRRVPLDELRDLLLDPDLPMSTVDPVWVHLVTRSRDEGGAATVGCVGVALPALFALAAELCAPFADDHHDIHAALLTGFLSELATINLGRPWVMWRLRCAALRAGHLFIRDALERPMPSDEDFHSSEPTPPWGHEDFVLARAVAEGVITGAQAELIGSTRLEPEYTLTQAAADRGVSYKAIEQVRRRAEHKLAAWLDEQAPQDDPSDRRERDVEIRAVNAATITAAARAAAHPSTRHPGKSRTVTTSRGNSSKKSSGSRVEKGPEIRSRGLREKNSRSRAHRLARPVRRDHTASVEHDTGGAAMRQTRPPTRRRPDRRTGDSRPSDGPGTPPAAAGQAAAAPIQAARHAPATPPTSEPSTTRRRIVRRRGTAITGLMVLALFCSVPAAHAETTQVLALAGSVDQVLTNTRNWVMGILAGLATAFLTIGGVRYLMGGGDPGEIEKAKTSFKASGIGYGLAALAPLVVEVLKGIVGA